ncbi:MAG: hypothetical protein R3251_02875 [Candidatus Spechtbacterales bacterium]|nr:hypothetical protein [Candidatus Spechtbacterales bacterium]
MFRPSNTDRTGKYVVIDGGKYSDHNGGGLVHEDAEVDHTVYVDASSIVEKDARVKGFVRLLKNTRVCSGAQLSGHLSLSDTRVIGKVVLDGVANISNATLVPSRKVKQI